MNARTSRLRGFRSVRALMVGVVLVACGFSWIAAARRQRDLVESSNSRYQVTYEWDLAEGGAQPTRRPRWLRRLEDAAGIDYLESVVGLSRTGLIWERHVPDVSGFPHLQELKYTNCRVNRDFFASVGKLRSLRRVWLLECTGFSTADLRYVCDLPNLEELTIRLWLPAMSGPNGSETPKIDDSVMPYIARAKRLRKLRLEWTDVGDQGLSWLPKMPRLESLCLIGNADTDRISLAGIRTIARMRSIKELRLCFHQIGDEAVAELAKMPNLESLNLTCTQVTPESIETLRRFKALKKLGIGFTPLSSSLSGKTPSIYQVFNRFQLLTDLD